MSRSEENQWEIIDSKGVIHSGDEEEMRMAFNIMADPDSYSEEQVKEYDSNEYEGDIKLVEVHAVIR